MFDPAALYARLRTSWGFVLGVIIIVAAWILWNLVPGIPHFDDPEFGRLNLLLSTEASVGGVVLLMVVERQSKQHTDNLARMRSLIEAVRDLLVEQRRTAATAEVVKNAIVVAGDVARAPDAPAGVAAAEPGPEPPT